MWVDLTLAWSWSCNFIAVSGALPPTNNTLDIDDILLIAQQVLQGVAGFWLVRHGSGHFQIPPISWYNFIHHHSSPDAVEFTAIPLPCHCNTCAISIGRSTYIDRNRCNCVRRVARLALNTKPSSFKDLQIDNIPQFCCPTAIQQLPSNTVAALKSNLKLLIGFILASLDITLAVYSCANVLVRREDQIQVIRRVIRRLPVVYPRPPSHPVMYCASFETVKFKPLNSQSLAV